MYVGDISEEASELSGLCKGPPLYRLISRAIQTLARKGNFDSLLAYLDIYVNNGNIVTLPREVETPLKIRIGKHPTFTRNKLYEFTLNGPGGDDNLFTGWQWMDLVRSPIIGELTSLGNQLTVISDPVDDGKVIRIYGLDRDNNEVSDIITLGRTVLVRSVTNLGLIPIIPASGDGGILVAGVETFLPTDVGSTITMTGPDFPTTSATIVAFNNVGNVRIDGHYDAPVTVGLNGVITSVPIINHPTTTNYYRVIRRVRKDITEKRVQLMRCDDVAVANYYPNEVEPKYRQIKLSKTAVFVHILFRTNTYAVTSDDDYIPLDSEQAVLMMIRALHKYNNSDSGFKDANDLEAQAVQFLKDDQDIRNSFVALAQADEIAPAMNLNINNRDSIIVADLYDEACSIMGSIGMDNIFDKLTEAKELLNRKYPMWRGTDGYVDLCVNRNCIVTLPRYVEIPIGINMGGRAISMRNRWFEFHPNGPGIDCQPSCRHWDDLGTSVTVNDPPRAQRLVAINDLAEDDGATLRIYGYDAKGRWLRVPNDDLDDEENPWIDGIELVARKGNVIPDCWTPKIKRITRIIRDETHGFQTLLAYDDNNSVATLVGYYYPDETEPNYSRIRLPTFAPWIRMRYRTKGLKVRTLTDPLHLRSRSAILNALRSLKAIADKDLQNAQAFEVMAANDLQEEETAQGPSEIFQFAFEGGSIADPLQGTY